MLEQDLIDYAAGSENEVCGLIVENTYFYPCNNVSVSPATAFEISVDDYIRIEQKGRITAVYHSHSGNNPVLSAADRHMQVQDGLEWWLASAGQLRKFRPVPHLLGRSFEHGVMDCYTLFRDAYHLCGIDMPDFQRTDQWWLRGENLYIKNMEPTGFYQIDPALAQPGDVIIRQPFKGADPCHAMILLDGNMVLHHDHAGNLSRREPFRPAYIRQTHSIWRHKQCSNLDLRGIYEDITARYS